MINRPLTPEEKENIIKYFGYPIEALTPELFRKALRELRARYHPDNFEQFSNHTVSEMATEKFQIIEHLSQRIQDHYNHDAAFHTESNEFFDLNARFAFDRMKIEINTADKDLKYHLFGAYYRWLINGDSFKIPGTLASIIIDDNHQGVAIGFRETIRLYLTFKESDSLEGIVSWIYQKIAGRADSLIIHKEIVPVDDQAMLLALKRQSFLRLDSGS